MNVYHVYGDIRGGTLHLGTAQAISEGSGETTSLRRLIGCSAMQYVNVYMYQNFMMLLSNCTHKGREFDPGPVPYFRGD